jgi:hypothetical protein
MNIPVTGEYVIGLHWLILVSFYAVYLLNSNGTVCT